MFDDVYEAKISELSIALARATANIAMLVYLSEQGGAIDTSKSRENVRDFSELLRMDEEVFYGGL